MLSQYRLLRRIACVGRLHRLFSTRAHPAQVAAVDSMLAMLVVSGGSLGLVAYDNAQAPAGVYYPPQYGGVLAIGAFIGLLTGVAAAIYADTARNDTRLVRSMPLTVIWTLVVVFAPVSVLWFGFELAFGDPLTLRNLLGVLVAFGPAMAPLGYRRLGFYDPYWVRLKKPHVCG